MADYYQGQGIEQLGEAQEQSQLLQQFEREAKDFQLNLTRLLVPGSQLPFLTQRYEKIQSNTQTIQRLQQQIAEFLTRNPGWLATEPQQLSTLINSYTAQVKRTTQRLAPLLGGSTPGAPSLASSPQSLRSIITDESQNQLDQLNQELLRISSVARQQEQQAGDAMEAAQGLEKLIIVLSMLGCGTFAGLLAWRTTRAIAQPIERVTQVAQQAAIESNFDLRVPVTTHDEVGLLAESLNLLIQRVSERTQDLEQAAVEAADQTQTLQLTLEELQKTQTQLVQTEKMSSLGQMMAGIAHEINNPVNFISGNLIYTNTYTQDLLQIIHLYQRHYPDAPPDIQAIAEEADLEFMVEDLPRIIGSMQIGAARIKEIVRSLRNFSRLDESDCKTVNVHEGIDSTILILQHRLKENGYRSAIQLHKHYGELPAIECYAGQLNQVFMNLVSNAIDALDQVYKKAVIEDLEMDRPDPQIIIATEMQGESVRVRIIDNGPGIPEAIQSRLFDPFFTTKPVGQGTGIGLSISYQIVVENHGGSLQCVSERGKGAEFVVEIPQRQELRIK